MMMMKNLSSMWSIFRAICYDERQAPFVRRVHLVMFSTSFLLKSIIFLFHAFRQEITVSVVTVLWQ